MKKISLLITLIAALFSYGNSALADPVVLGQIAATTAIGSDSIDVHAVLTSVNLGNHLGRFYVEGTSSEGSHFSTDTVYLNDGQINHIFYLTNLSENLEVTKKIMCDVLDTTGGDTVVLSQYHYESLPALTTTEFEESVPQSWGHSVINITTTEATVRIDSAWGGPGTNFSFVQTGGPLGLVSGSTYVQGMEYDVEIPISNCDPATTYTGYVEGDGGGLIVLPTSLPFDFTTDSLGEPSIMLNPVFVTNDTILMEVTVDPNGNSTNWEVLFENTQVLYGIDTAIMVDTLPMTGLTYNTTYLFEGNATSSGGVDNVSVSVTTEELDPIGFTLLQGDTTSILEGEMLVATNSEGGSAMVTVTNQTTGQPIGSFSASAGLDTVVVPYSGIYPNIGALIGIEMERLTDGAYLSSTEEYVPYQNQEINVALTLVQTTAVSHTVHVDAERSTYAGSIHLNISVNQANGLNPGPLPGVDTTIMSGVIDQDFVLNFQEYLAEHNIVITVTDTLLEATQSVSAYNIASLAEPNQPEIPVVHPISIAENGNGSIQVVMNPMSSNGGTGAIRGSDNPADLDNASSELESQSVPSFNTYTFDDWNILNLIQAGADTFYYRIILENVEGGENFNGDYAVALPEWVEPEPLEGSSFYGESILMHDSITATFTFDVEMGDSTDVILELIVNPSSDPIADQVVTVDGQYVVYVTGLTPNTFHTAQGRLKTSQGDLIHTGALMTFTTDESPEWVDPNSIEEVTRVNPDIRGDVYNLLGGMIGTNVRLSDLKNGNVRYGQHVIWTNQKEGLSLQVTPKW